MAAVRLLIERGADRFLKDDLYESTAEGGANHFDQHEVRDYLKSLGG